MLHKSFKSSKCKTSLKLATSRIKLMRNKKGVQINQMNRDLAQLLQTGQDRTARIRVEHVIREEKMVAAYDLIEIYCELIVARLPIIETQKTCPIDLKEAITSVIFAAPRCSDIPELANIQKQFKAKYGKEFVSAAVELRPDCGVSRMLVEKLSAVAPDVQTKVKVLSAVAKEHNIDWDATSFEMTESKPPNDLLNGPSNIEKASMESTDPPKVQPSYVNAVPSHEEKRNAPINYSEQNKRFTLGSQNTTPTDNDVETSSATHGDMSSSVTTSEMMEKRENWNMEFKDATSAAHAAAESAERAAMAARAAAKFSKEEKVAKQRPAGSHVSNIRDETHVSAPSGSIDEGRFKDSYERSSDDRKPKITSQHVHQSQHNTSQKATESSLDERRPKIVNQHIDQNEYDTSHRATERYGGNTSSSRPTAFKSNDDKIEDGKFVSDVHMEDEYFEDFKTEIGSSQKERSEYENSYYFADEASRKQPSIHSSRSHSSDSGDELDAPVHDKVGKKSFVGNPFAVVNQGNPFKETTNTSSNVDSPRDDEVISDDDDDGPKFDTGFDYDEVEATHSLENSHIWSPRRNTSSKSHLFTESVSFGDHSVKSVGRSEADDHEPASYDRFDGPDSDSESEIVKFDPEPLPQPRKTRIELNDLVEGESSFYDPEDDEKKPQSQRSTRRLVEENELKKHNEDQESYDTLEDRYDSLNFGTLTGGLRNKGGLKFPPYTKSATTDTSNFSKKSTDESSITGIETSIGNSLGSRVSKMEDKKPSSDSDSDDHRDNFRIRSSEKANMQANTRSRFTPPLAFVNDDGSDSDEDVAKQVPNRPRLGSGLSRRTRGTPSVPHLKSQVDSAPERVIPAYSEEVSVEPRSYTRKNKEEQVPDKQPVSPLRKAAEIGSTKSTPSVPKIPTREHIPSRSTVESGKHEAAKTQNMVSEKESGESLVKKASHVHPKLPDYESLAARLQSLRTDNK